MTSESSGQVKGLEEKVIAKDNEVNEMNTRLNQLETSLGLEQEKNVKLTSELAICNQRGDVLTNDKEALDLKLQECENKASNLKENLELESTKASELDAQIASLGGDLTIAKEALAKAQEDHEGCNGRLEECEAHKQELAGEVERLTGEIIAVTKNKESLENQMGALT